MFDTLHMYRRFAFGLGDFYRNRTSLQQARELVRQCIREREKNLLRIVKTAVFGSPKSPYLWLFPGVGFKPDNLTVFDMGL